MKAKLVFDLSEPEDRDAFAKASKADDFALVIWTFLNHDLRDFLKYGHGFKTADDALEGIRERLIEVMDDHNVNEQDIV